MTNTAHNGGPAFPQFETPIVGGVPLPVGGMTMRQWYIGQALAGYFAGPAAAQFKDDGIIALRCMSIADEIIRREEA